MREKEVATVRCTFFSRVGASVLSCLTTMVVSCRKAKPRFTWVCLSLMRRTLEGESVAKGASADRMVSTLVWGPRFLRIRAKG